jgi:hypothetical protein
MSTTISCDFCGARIPDAEEQPQGHKFTVSIIDSTAVKEILERDACDSCSKLLTRILKSTIETLRLVT